MLVILFRPPYFMLNFLYEIKEIVGRVVVTFQPSYFKNDFPIFKTGHHLTLGRTLSLCLVQLVFKNLLISSWALTTFKLQSRSEFRL